MSEEAPATPPLDLPYLMPTQGGCYELDPDTGELTPVPITE